MKDAYIISGVRTAIGNFAGTLAPVRADDLAAHVLKALLLKHPALDPAELDDVVLGCANQAGEDNRNVARMALLLAGYPVTVPGETLNRLCASGLSAAASAARCIKAGEAGLLVAGGVEHMTRGPWVMSKTSTPYGRDMQLHDSSFGWRFVNPLMKEKYGVEAMGETAENLAVRDSISREDQDKFALWSQQKAEAARISGRLAQEIISIEIPSRKGEPLKFNQDEFAKPATTLEALAKLKPAFRKEGSVTAGNASGLNDGAAAMLIASEKALTTNNLAPLARIVSSAASGVHPSVMGIGPVEAANKALKLAGIGWKDIDILELNEAFAAQSLACIRAWGLSDHDPRINPNGGAIALGHPLGMSGARILYSAALELKLQKKRYAMVTMCIGVGQGYAMVIEAC
ncbi:MAG: acetyl-CoA C-acyltransferase [Bacteroidia bacterium]|nr:acetyl-CoA C-acyltransferase [Bacteroidia bacterium]